MIKSIKTMHRFAVILAALFVGVQVEAKHYSKEKREECRGVADLCRKVIDTAMRCKEICDVLADDRSENYIEDRKICIARCREHITACEETIMLCRNHVRGLEIAEERNIMNRCIKKCSASIHSCKNIIKKCNVKESNKHCMEACRKASKRLAECIEACREIVSEEGADTLHIMPYESDEYEY